MRIQMIFCVETNKKADTDSIYITETLNYKYIITNQVKISKIYMGTKSKYNSKEVLKEIKNKIKSFSSGETKVIYCIDTDKYEKSYEHQKQLNDINQFCINNGYDLIWFCHDVEDVYLGKNISDSQKVTEASNFRKKKMITLINEQNLSCNEKRNHTSNILTILDKYLKRKPI